MCFIFWESFAWRQCEVTAFGFNLGIAVCPPVSTEIMSWQLLCRLMGRAFFSLINYLTCSLLCPVTEPCFFFPWGKKKLNFILFLLSLAEEYLKSKSTVLELAGWRRHLEGQNKERKKEREKRKWEGETEREREFYLL